MYFLYLLSGPPTTYIMNLPSALQMEHLFEGRGHIMAPVELYTYSTKSVTSITFEHDDVTRDLEQLGQDMSRMPDTNVQFFFCTISRVFNNGQWEIELPTSDSFDAFSSTVVFAWRSSASVTECGVAAAAGFRDRFPCFIRFHMHDPIMGLDALAFPRLDDDFGVIDIDAFVAHTNGLTVGAEIVYMDPGKKQFQRARIAGICYANPFWLVCDPAPLSSLDANTLIAIYDAKNNTLLSKLKPLSAFLNSS